LGAILAACLLGAYAAASLFAVMVALNLSGASAEGVPLADFGSFYASGQAAGQGLDPYEVYPLTMDAHLGAALLCISRLVLQDRSESSPLVRFTLRSVYTIAWLILLGSSVMSAWRQRSRGGVHILDRGATVGGSQLDRARRGVARHF
jgi:hypothetical protein